MVDGIAPKLTRAGIRAVLGMTAGNAAGAAGPRLYDVVIHDAMICTRRYFLLTQIVCGGFSSRTGVPSRQLAIW
jgi:hypothetical protein